MRRFERVTSADPAVIEYLKAHQSRLGPEPPAAVFVARDDDKVIGALLVWARSVLAVSLILPEHTEAEAFRPFMVFIRLIGEFERWAVSHGASMYAFSVHKSETHYLKVLANMAEPLEEAPLAAARGYRTFIRRLMEPLPKEHY